MEKNSFGQYVIRYDGYEEGDEAGGWITITPNAMLRRDNTFFCWIQVGDGEEKSILLPLNLEQISVLEQAFADFKKAIELRKSKGESSVAN